MRRSTAAAVAALALLGAAAAGLARGSLQQDFAAYFTAGGARRLGLDPYLNHLGGAAAPTLWDGSPFRHSRFLYPPIAAEAFRPFAALPFAASKGLFSAGALAALAAAATIGTAGRAGGRAADPRPVLVAAAIFFPVYLHFDRGQIDLYLLPLLLGAWRLRGRPLAAGALLATAAAIKPASLAVLPVLVALGRWRLVAAAAIGVAALAGMSAVVAPGLLAEYGRDVLPRAALYGEGGSEAMLLEAAEREPLRLGLLRDGDDRVFVDGRGYEPSLLERAMPWPVRVSASLPRLLAPDAPSRPAAVLPGAVTLVALVWAARRFVRRRDETAGGPRADDGEAMIYLAAMVASVVTSPAGWAMGLVFALPMLGPAARLWAAGRLAPRPALALGAAAVAAALPAPIAGLPALAGAALVALATAAALSSVSRAAT